MERPECARFATTILHSVSFADLGPIDPKLITFDRHFSDDEKKDRWVRIVAPSGADGVVEKREAEGPAPVHSALAVFASLLSPSRTLTHTLPADDGSHLPRKVYIHVAQKSGYNTGKASGATVRLSSKDGSVVEVHEGDGVYIMGDAGATLTVQNVGDRVAEVLLFDCC